MYRFAHLVLASALLATAAVGANQTPGQGTSGQSAAPARDAPAGAGGGDGRRLFTSGTTPSCATCHALADANATGNIGPDLDALKPDAARVRNAVEKGFEAMPAFGHVLSAEQIAALSQYVEKASGAR